MTVNDYIKRTLVEREVRRAQREAAQTKAGLEAFLASPELRDALARRREREAREEYLREAAERAGHPTYDDECEEEG